MELDMKPVSMTIVALALGACAPAFAQRPCSHVPQEQRIDCLNAEIRAGEARQREIDRRNRNLDRGIAVAGAVNNAGRASAGALGGIAGYKASGGNVDKTAHGLKGGVAVYDAAGRGATKAYQGYLKATDRVQEQGRKWRERRAQKSGG
jgi:hypothetical protein